MKLKMIVGSVIALTLGLGNIAHAGQGNYTPPERINCSLNSASQLVCNGFNRQYLVEDRTTAELEKGKSETFYFTSGVAYFTPSMNEANIFFTYTSNKFKLVKLKTINASIHPNVQKGDWEKFKEDIYTCDAGYMGCTLTNLPAFAKK